MPQRFFITLLLCSFVNMYSSAQCTISSTQTDPGIYPTDILSDMNKNTATNQALQIVFPDDTVVTVPTLGAMTVLYDSFKVKQILNLPAGLNWQCDAGNTNCFFEANPPNLTRGCIQFSGTPTTMNASHPARDSFTLEIDEWVTYPFIGPQHFIREVTIKFRINDATSIASKNTNKIQLSIYPVPASDFVNISCKLPVGTNLNLTLTDATGRNIWSYSEQLHNNAFSYQYDTHRLPVGLYHLTLDDPEHGIKEHRRFTIVR